MSTPIQEAVVQDEEVAEPRLTTDRPLPGAEPVDHTEHIVRLVQAMRRIEENPEHWNQMVWVRSDKVDSYAGPEPYVFKLEEVEGTACNTAFCLAGWAAALNQAAWISTDLIVATEDEVENGEAIDERIIDGFEDPVPVITVAVRARNLLGLTPFEQSWLFDGDRTLDQLRQGVGAVLDRFYAEMHPPKKPVLHWYDVRIDRVLSTGDRVEAASEDAARAVALEMRGLNEDAANLTVTVTETDPDDLAF